jgi:hypothetical protein
MSSNPKPSDRVAIIGADNPGAAWAILFAAERRAFLPLAGWEDRVAWRARALMALRRCRRGEAALEELGS